MTELLRLIRYLIFPSLTLCWLGVTVVLLVTANAAPQHSYKPPQGFVPDSATAIKIAEAILMPIYGKKTIEGERPFHAILKEGIWTIKGTIPKGMAGGVAEVNLSKVDGRILRVTHGR